MPGGIPCRGRAWSSQELRASPLGLQLYHPGAKQPGSLESRAYLSEFCGEFFQGREETELEGRGFLRRGGQLYSTGKGRIGSWCGT